MSAIEECLIVEGGSINLAIAASTIFQVTLATPGASLAMKGKLLFKAPVVWESTARIDEACMFGLGNPVQFRRPPLC